MADMARTMANISLPRIAPAPTAMANNIRKRKASIPRKVIDLEQHTTMTYFDLTSEEAQAAPSSPVAKRQKTNGGFDGGVHYDSADDSDDPFEGLGRMPSKHFTQPTQIIGDGTPQLPSSPKDRKSVV